MSSSLSPVPDKRSDVLGEQFRAPLNCRQYG